MKALFNIIVLLFPIIVFSQDSIKIDVEAKKVATEIIKTKRSIDSIKLLKDHEVKKQLRLISLINHKIQELQSTKSIMPAKVFKIIQASDTAALKPDSDAIYWEEIPRKWTGRLFHASDTKIRVFRYIDGQKVYAN